MRVGVTTFGCDGGKSGIGQYTIQLLRAFAAVPGDAEFEVIVHPTEKDVFVPPSDRFRAFSLAENLRSPMLNLCWHQLGLPSLCKKRAYDVLFIPAANRRGVIHAPCPVMGMVHDFSSIHVQGKYDPLRVFYIKHVLPAFIRRLKRIITVSECTKKDIVTFARVPKDGISVIMHGVDQQSYRPRDKSQAQRRLVDKYPLRSPYVLYISRIEHPGKNHVRLIRAFARLKASHEIPHQLVLAGSDWTRAEAVHEAARASGLKEDVLFLGFVPGGDMPDLYCGCDLFVFPSLYEGFGMPLLEAMSCGVPVACSNISSMPEVAGDAAALFDPYDEEAISDAMHVVLSNTALRAEMIDRGGKRVKPFTWEASARQHLAVFESACGSLVTRG
jgi:glycosyltransferase involved in cell wall biosynthesis